MSVWIIASAASWSLSRALVDITEEGCEEEEGITATSLSVCRLCSDVAAAEERGTSAVVLEEDGAASLALMVLQPLPPLPQRAVGGSTGSGTSLFLVPAWDAAGDAVGSIDEARSDLYRARWTGVGSGLCNSLARCQCFPSLPSTSWSLFAATEDFITSAIPSAHTHALVFS